MSSDVLLGQARKLDSENDLAPFRGRFEIPTRPNGAASVYLVGNSLGLQPKKARQYIEEELEDWKQLAVEAHFKGKRPWKFYQNDLAPPLARLVGAKPSEVVAMNSTGVNLHLLMVSFYLPTRERYKIAIEANAFPSDRYIVESQLRLHSIAPNDGLVVIKPRPGENTLRTDDILQTLKEDQSIAMLMLGGVNYYTGQAFDIGTITREAQRVGITVGYDLAHAVGNLVLRLHDWNVDFAVWCSYKYLNAGPGAIGGAFIHERHSKIGAKPRLEGWWGTNENTRFQMRPEFEPIEGAKGWQISNPPVFSAAPLYASLEIFEEAGIERIRKIADRMTQFIEKGIESEVADGILEQLTPREAFNRGSQLSFRLKSNAEGLTEELKAAGIYCDFRAPDVLRVAVVPLYNRFEDLHQFVTFLGKKWPKKQ